MGYNKPSLTSMRADILVEEIRDAIARKEPGIWGLHNEDLVNLRMLTWKRLTADERKHVVLSIKGDALWVSVSDKPKGNLPQTKAGNLKNLLRKCLVHVDDDNLYDEILEVLHDN